MENLENRCRICLEENEPDKMYPLFEDIETSTENSSQNIRLSEKVELCCRVKIEESINMPNRICQKCFDLVYYWTYFHNLCLDTQVYLESLLLENEPSGKDLEDVYENLLITNFPNTNKLKFCEESNDEDDSHDRKIGVNFDGKEEEIYFVLSEDNVNVQNEPIEDDNNKPENQIENKKKRRRRGSNPPTSFMCSICGNVYDRQSTFNYHMGTHNDLRPHECEICGKGFRQVCELKSHIRRHTGERPYKCQYCERSFIDRSEKYRHERTHTNTRPYSCKICGKSFSYSAILRNHMILHSGEKKFNCYVCNKAFTLQHQLKAHLRTIIHKQRESQYTSD